MKQATTTAKSSKSPSAPRRAGPSPGHGHAAARWHAATRAWLRAGGRSRFRGRRLGHSAGAAGAASVILAVTSMPVPPTRSYREQAQTGRDSAVAAGLHTVGSSLLGESEYHLRIHATEHRRRRGGQHIARSRHADKIWRRRCSSRTESVHLRAREKARGNLRSRAGGLRQSPLSLHQPLSPM